MGIKSKRVLSLFSGCGGMDLGFEGNFEVLKPSVPQTKDFVLHETRKGWVQLIETGFQTVFSNDILTQAENTWKPYFKNRGKDYATFHKESIVDLVKMHKKGEFNFPENIDLVTGGFPCQDFSLAGNRKGFSSNKSHAGKILDQGKATVENRGQLYIWMKEVIGIVQPKVFIAENVKGLVSLGDVKEIIENDFREIGQGYVVLPAKVLNAKHYGVPQSRERLIFIGLNRKYLNKSIASHYDRTNQFPENLSPYPIPTHGGAALPLVTLKQAFRGLKEPDVSRDISQQTYSKAKFYGKKLQGNIEIKLDSVGPTIRAEHHGNIEFRRLSVNNEGRYTTELSKGKPERRLTVRECARIQTFPDDYAFVRNRGAEFPIAGSGAYKVIGNAVPPLLAFHLGKRLSEVWEEYFGEAKMIETKSKTETTYQEFLRLLEDVVASLTLDAKSRPEYYQNRGGSKLESDVFNFLNTSKLKKSFTIELKSGQKFPDIICYKDQNECYGIEVKTTVADHWTSPGSSIREGTRVDNVVKVHLLFGKLGGEVGFRQRLYEDCLHKVAITHSPRYLIDMNATETIFDKVGIKYDDLRSLDNPFKPVKEHLRKDLKGSGRDIWWMDEDDSTVDVSVTPWNELSVDEKHKLLIEGFALFPEIIGDEHQTKYRAFSSYLVSRYGIVHSSIRDLFTANGQEPVLGQDVPQVIYKLHEFRSEIKKQIKTVAVEDAEYYWNTDNIKTDRLVDTWVGIVTNQTAQGNKSKELKAIIVKILKDFSKKG